LSKFIVIKTNLAIGDSLTGKNVKGRVHLRHDVRYDLRFDLRFGACVIMTRQGNAFPCVIMHDAGTESQVESQVDTPPEL
jgi:hypothetical protein